MFGDFGKILVYDDVLSAGVSYVFTYSHGRWFEYNSDTWVQANLQDRVYNFGWGNVISASRPFFSDHYVVTIIPLENHTLSEWITLLNSIWEDMGYGHATFIQAEGGTVSTQPGGLESFLPSVTGVVGESVGQAVSGMIKPIFPYLLIGFGVYLVVTNLPQLIESKRR